jgi:NADPH:quinone reductase-like Zn-dependent oxidoreductase
MRRLGAKATIDARDRDAADKLAAAAPDGVDVVLAFAGGRELERLLDLVARGGRVVYPNGVDPEPEKRPGVRVKGYDAATGADEFSQLARAAERARLRVPVAATFPLGARPTRISVSRRPRPGARSDRR